MVFNPGVGLGATGGLTSKRYRTLRNRGYAVLGGVEGQLGRSYGEAQAFLKQAYQDLTKGYEDARQEVTTAGQGATQAALDRETQGAADISQNLASRGLGSTTVGGNLQRGLMSDTNRRITEIQSTLAGLYSQLQAGKAQGQAQIGQAQSQLAMNKFAMGAPFSEMRFNLATEQGGAPSKWSSNAFGLMTLNSLLQAGGKIGGAVAGGGF